VSKKHICAICHGLIAVGREYKSPWEDVWLRWKGRPGRVFKAAPCLVCRAELLADLEMARQGHAEHPEFNYDVDIQNYEALLATLEHAPYARDDYEYPNIYTHAFGIDRAEAERMLAWFLEDKYGVKNPKFIWKRPKTVVVPTGFGNYQTEEHG
jgi:hypothetical protein